MKVTIDFLYGFVVGGLVSCIMWYGSMVYLQQRREGAIMKVTELIWKFLKWQHLNSPLWVGSVFILMGAVTISRTEKTEIEYLIAVMVLLFGAGLVFLNNLGWNIYDMLEEKLENNTSNLAKK